MLNKKVPEIGDLMIDGGFSYIDRSRNFLFWCSFNSLYATIAGKRLAISQRFFISEVNVF